MVTNTTNASRRSSSASPTSTPTKQLDFGTPTKSSSINVNHSKSLLMSPSMERLSKVKENVTSITGEIKDGMNLKKELEQSKIYEMRDAVSKLEKTITVEQRKRLENDKVYQSMIENKMNALHDTMEKRLTERFSQSQITVDILTKRVSMLERMVVEEREKSEDFSIKLKTTVVEQLQELKNLLDAERDQRMEREGRMIRKLSDDLLKLSERLDSEVHAREHLGKNIYEEVNKREGTRIKFDNQFRQTILSDLDALRDGIRQESETREQVDEHMVQTIDQIVKQLHESLRQLTKQ